MPLMQPEPPGLAHVDLYSPFAISPREVLLAGTRSGRPEFDVYLYDVDDARLVNLTATPELDEGDLCVAPGGRLVSYRAGHEQRFARVVTRLEPLRQARVPGFQECRFADATTLLGIERTHAGWALHHCALAGETATCAPTLALEGFDHVVGFSDPAPGAVGLVARRRGEEFRRAWLLDAGGAALRPAPLAPRQADVLEQDDGAVRYGFESRYWSSLAADFAGVVYRTRRVGGTWFAVVATPELPRTLARLGPQGWLPVRHRAADVPAAAAPPEEVWLGLPGGARYQAFRFGTADARDVALWWHGGPHENVSPRFHPYFAALNRLGFTVLAVNYPGSTGRGAAFERRYDAASIADCLAAVFAHLGAGPARRVVSWSVSSGDAVQEILLARGHPVAGVVDQSGWGHSRILELAAARGVPVFTIRGRHDPSAPVARVDHAYAGGHDVTLRSDFEALVAAVARFLADLPPGREADGLGP